MLRGRERKTNVFANTASMAGMSKIFITGKIKGLKKTTEGFGARVAEALVPAIGRQDGEALSGAGRRQLQRIEVARAVTAEYHRLGVEILDRETTRVKFDSNWIILSESSYRDKILDEGGGNKNILKSKGMRRGGYRGRASVGNGKGVPIANNDLC